MLTRLFRLKWALCALTSILSLRAAFAGDTEPVQFPEKTKTDKVRWKPILMESLFFLGVEHGFRLATQDYTRHYLKGPFFEDYGKSIGNLHGWADGDPFLINYVGHPMQGAVAGYIFAQNDPKYQRVIFGRNRDYWKGRMRATLFAFAYSEQFEQGPISESSIGTASAYYPQWGMVDHVITPTVGLVWMIAEDSLDKYFISRMEARTQKRWLKIALRGGLNPSRSMANAMRLEVPWHRDTRSDNLSEPPVVSYNTGVSNTLHLEAPNSTGDADEDAGVAGEPLRSSAKDNRLNFRVPTFELQAGYSYTQLAVGKQGSLSCNGGGANASYNLNGWLSVAADVEGCKMFGPGVNISGDSLTYMAGPRITFRNSTPWTPYLQFLAGGNKLSTETMYPELKPPNTNVPELEQPALHASYTSQDQTNAFGIKVGGGVERVVNNVMAVRVLDVEDMHLWARELNARHYPNNVIVSTGVVIRFGTW